MNNPTFNSISALKALLLFMALFLYAPFSAQSDKQYAAWQTPAYAALQEEYMAVLYYSDDKYDQGLSSLQEKIDAALAKDPKNPLLLLMAYRTAMDRVALTPDVLEMDIPEDSKNVRWDSKEFSIAEKLRLKAVYERLEDQSQKALAYLLRAEPLGEKQTLHALASYYIDGYFPKGNLESKGTTYLEYKVDNKVLDLLERSFNLGYEDAGYALSRVLILGLGSITQDTSRGEKIAQGLKEKAAFYYEIGRAFLESDLSNDFTMPVRSLHQASRYMHLAAESGFKEADLLLSKSYLNALGASNFTPLDTNKAYFHADRAANSASSLPEAYFIKAILTLYGEGVTQDRKAALAMLLELKALGNKFSQSQDLEKYIAEASK